LGSTGLFDIMAANKAKPLAEQYYVPLFPAYVAYIDSFHFYEPINEAESAPSSAKTIFKYAAQNKTYANDLKRQGKEDPMFSFWSWTATYVKFSKGYRRRNPFPWSRFKTNRLARTVRVGLARTANHEPAALCVRVRVINSFNRTRTNSFNEAGGSYSYSYSYGAESETQTERSRSLRATRRRGAQPRRRQTHGRSRERLHGAQRARELPLRAQRACARPCRAPPRRHRAAASSAARALDRWG
jgi:hypothetical protein